MKITPHQVWLLAVGGSCVAVVLGLLGSLVALG
jgi:hypothetical protein